MQWSVLGEKRSALRRLQHTPGGCGPGGLPQAPLRVRSVQMDPIGPGQRKDVLSPGSDGYPGEVTHRWVSG